VVEAGAVGLVSERDLGLDSRSSDLESALSALELHLAGAALRDRDPGGLVPSAVCVPLLLDDDHRLALLFTRRADRLRTHRGEIAFPGGRVDASDADAAAAAARELSEELGFSRERLRILGRLSHYPTITDYLIHPYVAWMGASPQLTPSAAEVDEVFTVPLFDLLEGRVPHWSEDFEWEGRARRVYFYDWNGHRIWGATGGILREFLEILRSKRGDTPDPDSESAIISTLKKMERSA
jgi:8-oxo-dGTP pyrophosphatase MutT (NUDIX family)